MLMSAVAVFAASPVDLLLAGVAVALGAVVGLVPALVLGMVLGLVPRPRALRGRHRAPTALRAQPSAAPIRPVAGAEPLALDVPAVAVPASMRQREPEAPETVEAADARDRHRRLYDDEYEKQLAHLDTLRRTIRTRLAVGAQPLSDDRSRES